MNQNKDLFTVIIRKMLALIREHFFMETYVTTVYVIADEIIRILKIQDDPQSKMSTSEVITFAIVTAKFFCWEL